MIRKKIKWLDPNTVLIMLFFLYLITVVLTLKYEGDFDIMILIVTFALIISTIMINKSEGLILENRFDKDVIILRKGKENQKLLTTPAKASGVNTGIKPGKVFKIRNGTNVYIDKNGNVKSYSILSALVNRKGWIDKNDLNLEECKNWEKLFNYTESKN
jgi:hypothetical protein